MTTKVRPPRRSDPLTRAITSTRSALKALETLRDEMDALRSETPVHDQELLGAREASELLQLDRTEFARRRRNGRIPAPIAELAAGPVWLKAQFTWPNTLKEITQREARERGEKHG